jgi:hypothetical protein
VFDRGGGPRHELIILHRSVAMLRPDERALTRDEALELFG